MIEAAAVADPIVPKQMTQKAFKAMMRAEFTVRRPVVKSCGHKLDIHFDPHNNCPDCWFAYFNNNKSMTEIADECWTQAGRDVLTRARGKKFVRNFLMFMSTIARFHREAAAAEAEKAKTNGEQETNPVSPSSDGDSATHTSIGGVAGDTQSVGGVQSDPHVNDYVSENPLDGETTEGFGASLSAV